MTGPKIDPNVSWGHILLALTIVAGGVANYVTMDVRTQNNASTIVRAQLEVEAVEVRVRALESNAARADERLTSILTIIGRTDSRVERIEQRLETVLQGRP